MKEPGNEKQSENSLNLIEESNSSNTDSSMSSMNLEDIESKMQRFIMMKKTFFTIAIQVIFSRTNQHLH